MSSSDRKRESGQYFTRGNPFGHLPFSEWAARAGLPEGEVLEPFAGSNSLVETLSEMGLCARSASFDIAPAGPNVRRRDTLDEFPAGYEICVTNPPWLAKNSATVRGLHFPECPYDDLYKFALRKCLDNCGYIAALVPESFITANLFQDRLQSFVSLTSAMFVDTRHPVGLALFVPHPVDDVDVWSGTHRIGLLSEIKRLRPSPLESGARVVFNDPDGNVGLIALDDTKEASIRFCEVDELADYAVKSTGRHITKLSVDGNVRIADWNRFLTQFREKTQDVLMTCYKALEDSGLEPVSYASGKKPRTF